MDEEKEIIPINSQKYRYECYICGMKVISCGEPVRHCDCKYGKPKKILNWDHIKNE